VGTIIPRWEWRTFGNDLVDAETRFAALGAENLQASEETYLVAAGSDANVKIRDQLLDIKILENENDDGLERWRPVLKEGFPLSASAVSQVREALGLSKSPQTAGAVSQDRLLADLAPPGSGVRVISVHKTRTRYHVQGCIAEVTSVIADGSPVRTIAIEDENPSRVIAAVRAMGLEGYANISYPRGLKELVGLSRRGPKP
jgi:exopolyphosphatase / guanosine-5'-triphosphate,3'-diphosphate pyrophosphatase